MVADITTPPQVVESIVRGGVNARNSADGNGSGVMIDEDEDALFQERQQMRRHVDRMIQLMSERNRRTNITQLLAEIGIHAAPGGPSCVGGGDLPPKSRTRAPVASRRVKASFTRRSVPEPPVATTRASQMRRAAPPATTRTVAPKVPKPVSKPMQGRQQQQQQQQQPKPPQRHQAQLGPRSYPQHAGKWAPPPSSVVDDDGDAPSAVVAPPPARLAAAASPKRLPPRSAGASALPRYSAPPWRAAPRVRAGDEVPRDDVDKGTTSATLHSPRGAPTRVAEVPEDDDEVVMPSAGPSMSAVVVEGPSSPHASRDPSNRDGRVVGAPVVPASSIYGADGAVQPESAESGATFEEARVRCVVTALRCGGVCVCVCVCVCVNDCLSCTTMLYLREPLDDFANSACGMSLHPCLVRVATCTLSVIANQSSFASWLTCIDKLIISCAF